MVKRLVILILLCIVAMLCADPQPRKSMPVFGDAVVPWYLNSDEGKWYPGACTDTGETVFKLASTGTWSYSQEVIDWYSRKGMPPGASWGFDSTNKLFRPTPCDEQGRPFATLQGTAECITAESIVLVPTATVDAPGEDAGRMYFDSDDVDFLGWDGTSWRSFVTGTTTGVDLTTLEVTTNTTTETLIVRSESDFNYDQDSDGDFEWNSDAADPMVHFDADDHAVGIGGAANVSYTLEVTGWSHFFGHVFVDGEFTQDAGNSVFNEVGASYDFRVENEFNENVICSDSSDNALGIMCDPDGNHSLEVSGNMSVSATLECASDFDVDGNTTLDKVDIAETLEVNMGLIAHDSLDVDGDTTLDAVTISESLEVNAHATIENLLVEQASTFNSSQGDHDCVWYGNGVADLLYTDAGANRVGIGTNAPDASLEVEGDVHFEGDTTIDTTLEVTEAIGIGTAPLAALHIDKGYTLENGIVFGDGDTGICEKSDDTLQFNAGGVIGTWGGAYLQVGSSGSNGGIMVELASNINPTIVPTRDDADTGIGRAGADQLSLIAGGVEQLQLSATEAVFSKAVEINGTLEVHGITAEAASPLRINIADNNADAFTVKQGNNNYLCLDTTNGSEAINIGCAGVVTLAQFSASSAIFNDGGINTDFRVESQDNENFLFCDASEDKIGIGTNTPGASLEVAGNIKVSETVEARVVSAVSNAGLKLTDDAGNLGIHVEDNTGDVGIGKADPTTTVDILESAAANANVTLTASSAAHASVYMLGNSDGESFYRAIYGSSATGNSFGIANNVGLCLLSAENEFALGTSGNHPLHFCINGTTELQLSDGYLLTNVDGAVDLGSAAKSFGSGYFDNTVYAATIEVTGKIVGAQDYNEVQTASGSSNVFTLTKTAHVDTDDQYGIDVSVEGAPQDPASNYTYSTATNQVTIAGANLPAGTKVKFSYNY